MKSVRTKQKKILFTDMDGTLLFSENEKTYFKEQDLDAVREFQQKGNLIAVNSGRALPWIIAPLEKSVTADYLIAGTGSIITDRHQQILYEEAMSFTSIRKIINEYFLDVPISLHTKECLYSLSSGKHFSLPITRINSIDILENEKLYGMSFHFKNNEDAKSFADWLEKSEIQDVKAFVNINDVDMVKRGCSKGTAIHILSQKLGLTAEQVYAIGDAENDIDMLKSVKHGYTFHHSQESVKQHAEGCVESVAELIYKIMNN